MGMTIDFTGKTVLVTGAAKGLGKDMALLFASCGANVHIGDFNTEEAEKTVAELKNFGVKADFTKCDVSNEEEVQKMVEDAKALGNGKCSWSNFYTRLALYKCKRNAKSTEY